MSVFKSLIQIFIFVFIIFYIFLSIRSGNWNPVHWSESIRNSMGEYIIGMIAATILTRLFLAFFD